MSQLGDAAGVQWVEAKNAAQHPTMHRASPQQRIVQSTISIVPQLRDPRLDYVAFVCFVLDGDGYR